EARARPDEPRPGRSARERNRQCCMEVAAQEGRWFLWYRAVHPRLLRRTRGGRASAPRSARRGANRRGAAPAPACGGRTPGARGIRLTLEAHAARGTHSFAIKIVRVAIWSLGEIAPGPQRRERKRPKQSQASNIGQGHRCARRNVVPPQEEIPARAQPRMAG